MTRAEKSLFRSMMKRTSVLALLLLALASRTGAEKLKDDKVLEQFKKAAALRKAKKPGLTAKVKGKIKNSTKKEKSSTSILFPGVTPEEYNDGEQMNIFVDIVQSKKTQVPFEFYDLPVCPGPVLSKKERMRASLGAKLQGYNYKASPYPITALKSVPCTPLCLVKITPRKLKWLRKLVNNQYRIHMTLDSLPLLMSSPDYKYTVRGYPVGFKSTKGGEEEFFLYNHLRFTIGYNQRPDGAIHIIRFEAHPVSIRHGVEGDAVKFDTQIETCDAQSQGNVVNDPANFLPLDMSDRDVLEVVYSYETYWVETDSVWADRWDVYLVGSPDDDVHYFAIVNSLMVVIFLSAAVSFIMIRTLKKDIAAYNDISMQDDDLEETGWKLVHGDVFRPPKTGHMLLSVCVGTGAQIGVAVTVTLFSALLGVLSPMNKGETLTTILVLYVLSGSVAGYISSRIYKLCDGKAWKRATLLTAAGFPGLLVGMFLCLDLFLAFAGAATAVSVWTIISLFLLWVCVSTPLVFVGSYFGFRANKIEAPTKTNQIARFIPEAPWYTKSVNAFFLSGLLPFGSVSIELLFIMAAIWLHHIYYAIGFLLFVVLILALTCAEVAIVMNYLQLASENHQWWWQSFFNSASTGFYLLLYSIWFLYQKLSLVGFLPILVYFTYMTMMSITLGLLCGSIGFLSCLLFNKAIYSAVKVD